MRIFFFIFLAISLGETLRHYYLITRNIHPNKLLSWIGRAAAGIYCGIMMFEIPVWQAILTLAVLDWYIHDYFLNLLRGKPYYYLSDGPIDLFQRNHPNEGVWFVWKTIAVIGLVGGYFLNS